MAGTIDLGGDDSVRFELDYDDSLKAISLRCVNTSDAGAFGRVTAMDGSGNLSATATYGKSFGAGTTILAIPTAPANKAIALTANATKPGKYNGYEFGAQVPG
jgi:hypothetical protein